MDTIPEKRADPDLRLNIYSAAAEGAGEARLVQTLEVARGRLLSWSKALDICTRNRLENDIRKGLREGNLFFRSRTLNWDLSDFRKIPEPSPST